MPQHPVNFCLAPVRGLTDHGFRRIFADYFVGLDRAMAPFVTTVSGHRVKSSHLKDLRRWKQEKLPLVPQVLGNDPAQLDVMLLELRAMGFHAVNLNAGCPHPGVIAHGHGAGLLGDLKTLRAMLEVGIQRFPGAFSVKLRLGIQDGENIDALADLCNEFPLGEVILHPRTAAQRYDGSLDLEGFSRFLSRCSHRLVYNGDITERAGFQRLQRLFPEVESWMLGRGLFRNPFLADDLRGCVPRNNRSAGGRVHVGTFILDLWHDYETMMTSKNALGRIKNLCRYMQYGPFLGREDWVKLRTLQTGEEFRAWHDRGFVKK